MIGNSIIKRKYLYLQEVFCNAYLIIWITKNVHQKDFN